MTNRGKIHCLHRLVAAYRSFILCLIFTPMPFTQAQQISIFFTPVVTGCVSATASITLITTIFHSRVKLGSIYRRLVFAVSCFDVLQSLSQIVSSLPIPPEDAAIQWGAVGNDLTCSILGSAVTIGSLGSCGYSASLTVYFFLAIRLEMSDAEIKKRVEPFLHAIPIVYIAVVLIYFSATDNFCWVDPSTKLDRIIGFIVPIAIAFHGNCILMLLIRRYVRQKERRAQRHRQSWVVSLNQPSQHEPQASAENDNPVRQAFLGLCHCCKKRTNNESPPSHGLLAARLSGPSLSSIQRQKEVSNRALAYVLGFTFTYGFSLLYRGLYFILEEEVPFVFLFLPRLFFPLQGLFNVLIFTHSHIISLRKNHSEYTWFRAFWEVVKAGGDSDQVQSGTITRRRSSLRQQQLVLAQCMARNLKNENAEMSDDDDKMIDDGKNSDEHEDSVINLHAYTKTMSEPFPIPSASDDNIYDDTEASLSKNVSRD